MSREFKMVATLGKGSAYVMSDSDAARHRQLLETVAAPRQTIGEFRAREKEQVCTAPVGLA
jgi:hypothetical protein